MGRTFPAREKCSSTAPIARFPPVRATTTAVELLPYLDFFPSVFRTCAPLATGMPVAFLGLIKLHTQREIVCGLS